MSGPGLIDVERFREVIARSLGLHFDDTKLGQLEEVLCRRARARGSTESDYVLDLRGSGSTSPEVPALAQELTVGETYFFRNHDQFDAFTEVALRPLLAAPGPFVRLLSAGCSSGEEPYSLAMILEDSGARAKASIRAVDINPAALEKARRARYSSWALRETPAPVRERWFHGGGGEFMLDPSIVSMVRLDERNLAFDDPDLWRPGSYDVVFCRNVLMYFTPANAAALVGRITRALVPGGYLFLGHAETLRGLSSDYHLCHTHGTFYYQRKEFISHAAAVPAERTGVPARLGWASSWLDTVEQASERIRALSERTHHANAPSAPPPVRADASFEVGIALELLQAERFTEALHLLASVPEEATRSSELLLLRAVLLTHGGQLEAAERVCAELLRIDDLNAASHYVRALCREGAGDRAGAVEHDQVACYLDASFAMPRLHLGLMARRAGDKATARRDLRQAEALLEREDPSRLILFGGGFSRDALIALCRAEIDALGCEP